jgi:hypothetical protein
LFDDSVESIVLPTKFSNESVLLALRLSECYESHQILDQAESVYFRLYRAHHKVQGVEKATVTKYSDLYLAFLRRHGFHDRIISFYQELLISYRNVYGPSDKKTIELLYNLADTCRAHQMAHRYWVEYYLEIINTLNKDDVISQRLALRAVVTVAEHYHESRRFTEALVRFKAITMTSKSPRLP